MGMNEILRAATGRAPVNEETPSNDETSSNDEPEPELSMNDLLRRATGRSYLLVDEQLSETAKPNPNQVFNDLIRRNAHSGRQFTFGLPVSDSSDEQTEDAS